MAISSLSRFKTDQKLYAFSSTGHGDEFGVSRTEHQDGDARNLIREEFKKKLQRLHMDGDRNG